MKFLDKFKKIFKKDNITSVDDMNNEDDIISDDLKENPSEDKNSENSRFSNGLICSGVSEIVLDKDIHLDNSIRIDDDELVIDGQEMVKGYSELVNPIQQKRNFEEQAKAKQRGDAEAMDYDKEYILAMEHGFPPVSGIGFLFPITKPLD